MKIETSNIPVVILSGGSGIRLGSDRDVIPKSMVNVNGKPLLLYILDHYSRAGFEKFIICGGYRVEMIKEFISQLPCSLSEASVSIDRTKWQVTVLDTGVHNKTGSRAAQVRSLVDHVPMFCMTYGDTVSDVNLRDLLSFHINQKKIATLAAVHVPTRFRILGLYRDEDLVRGFAEKSILQNDYINGGFYVFNSSVFNLKSLKTEPDCTLEAEVLEELVTKKELFAFKHTGFWQHLDHERDRQKISLWLDKIF